jgi:hypothetical protein
VSDPRTSRFANAKAHHPLPATSACTARPASTGSACRSLARGALVAAVAAACVPAGNSPATDSGAPGAPGPATTARVKQAPNVLRTVFEEHFDRPTTPSSSASAAATGSAAASGEAARANPLGPNWYQAQTNVWHIENGKLCGEGAHNHGVWLQRPIPINARIEFDATSDSPDGDLKAEIWGDGQSAATAQSYTNATSYLTILGGWKNTEHVLARINEHGPDRKEIRVDPKSDDPRQRPVTPGQSYHFKIERSDGKTVHWSVNGIEYLAFPDSAPLAGIGHDHFGFNDWEVKVCFDNIKVTPL